MKKLLLIIFISSVLSGQTIDSMHNSFGRQIITKEDIDHSGAARLSDLFQLINSSVGATIDGYHLQISLSALSPGWEHEWILYIDGQRIDLDFPYMANINLIPVSVSEIEFIEVITIPGFESGDYNNAGKIHIHTSAPPDGLSLNASLASANEIGDPGPYKYINTQLPNIDQVGPYYWAGLKWGSKNFKASLGLKHHLQIYSDPNIDNRFIDYPWEFKQLRMMGASFKIDIKIAESNHSLFVSRTETGDPVLFNGYGSDLLFFPPAGREIPTESKYTHAGISGNFNIGATLELNYQFKFSSSLLDWTLEPVNNVFDWNINNFNGMIEVGNLLATSKTKLSIGFNHVKLLTHYSLRDDSFTLFRISGQTSGIKSSKLDQLIFGGIVFDGNRSAAKVGTRLEYIANEDVKINANIFYSNKLPEETNNFWFWVNKGYNFLNEYSIPYEGSTEQNISSQLIGDLEFQFKAGGNFTFSFGGFYRKFMNYHLERQQFTYNSSAELSQTKTILSNSENGTAAGLNVNIDSKITSSLKQNIFYQFNPYFNGSELFYDAWQSFPQHKFKYTLDFSPVSSFSMRGMVTYVSETYWPDYYGADNNTGGIISHIVEGNLLIDLAFRKTFWDDKIRATLLLQNMLGNFIQYHPVGALFDITFFMKLELMLDSIL